MTSQEPEDPRRHEGAERPETSGAVPPERTRGWTRRRFGQGVAAAAPLVMTMHSRPLQAAANCTVSGWVSGNVSLHHDLEECGGYTPGFWQGNSANLPGDWEGNRDIRLVNDPVYGLDGLPTFTTITGNDDVRDTTMHDAVDQASNIIELPKNSDDRKLVRFGTASLLNARHVSGYPLSEDVVRTMVRDAYFNGEYIAPSGDRLSKNQVWRFLENTMNGKEEWGP